MCVCVCLFLRVLLPPWLEGNPKGKAAILSGTCRITHNLRRGELTLLQCGLCLGSPKQSTRGILIYRIYPESCFEHFRVGFQLLKPPKKQVPTHQDRQISSKQGALLVFCGLSFATGTPSWCLSRNRTPHFGCFFFFLWL